MKNFLSKSAVLTAVLFFLCISAFAGQTIETTHANASELIDAVHLDVDNTADTLQVERTATTLTFDGVTYIIEATSTLKNGQEFTTAISNGTRFIFITKGSALVDQYDFSTSEWRSVKNK